MDSPLFARSMVSTALIAALLPLHLVAAQQPPAKTAAPKPAATPATAPVSYVKVTGVDYEFITQDVVPSGIVTFDLMNGGADLHAMAVFELPPNHTLKDFLDQYHSQGMIPAWMTGMGQTPTIAPKSEAFLSMRMKPGRYILACLIPARDGRMHTEKGMVKLITVK